MRRFMSSCFHSMACSHLLLRRMRRAIRPKVDALAAGIRPPWCSSSRRIVRQRYLKVPPDTEPKVYQTRTRKPEMRGKRFRPNAQNSNHQEKKDMKTSLRF